MAMAIWISLGPDIYDVSVRMRTVSPAVFAGNSKRSAVGYLDNDPRKMAAGGVAGKDVMEKRLEQSFKALQHYFSPSRKQEGAGNPAQLVLFAEHAAKVS